LGNYADEIGRALRRARAARSLTLRQVLSASSGEFKATSVAGYERGERTISVERFCRLCEVYEVAPQVVLADIVNAIGGKAQTVIDLSRLEEIGDTERQLVSEYIGHILAQRREPPTETITLREGDLEVLASEAGTTRDELAQALEPAIRRDRD
jgi:transcriptional regulator with XRE-family HTH domain